MTIERFEVGPRMSQAVIAAQVNRERDQPPA